MTNIISFPLKGSFGAAVREQDPMRRHSRGYPAQRDPAAENPAGLLQDMNEVDELKLRQRYAPSKQTEPA